MCAVEKMALSSFCVEFLVFLQTLVICNLSCHTLLLFQEEEIVKPRHSKKRKKVNPVGSDSD